METQDATSSSGAAEAEAPRRCFLTSACAATVGAVVGLGPVATGLYVALDPLRKRLSSDTPFVPVTALDALPADGQSRLFRVVADRQDAWTRHGLGPIGAVYLRRTAEKPDEVVALHPVCPHLGCFVNSRKDGSFHCPCHDSTFQADGSIGNPNSPSPRGLDHLEARIENGKVLVQFINFETNRKDKKPIL